MDYLLTAVKMEDYLKSLSEFSTEDRQNPYFAPILEKDLRHLPETLILTAEYDPFAMKEKYMAENFYAAGNHVEVHRISEHFMDFLRWESNFCMYRRVLNILTSF